MIPISRRLLLITLIESFATGIVELGVYFYAKEVLNFSASLNLFMAVLFGLMYVLGAWASHPISKRFGERRTLAITTALQLLCHALLAFEFGGAAMLIAVNSGVALTTGGKWPVIESYITAGHTPKRAARAVGFFNLAWSSAVVPAMAGSGLLIDTWSGGLFAIPAAINVATLIMIRRLVARPVHLAHDHPERLSPQLLARYAVLMKSSRWLMVTSYTLLFVITPLLPNVFERLAYSVTMATVFGALLHLLRTASFFVLERHPWWHGRADILVVSTFMLPIGCIMVLFGNHIAWVLAGEVMFGIATGITYYGALYYAMVVSNASVDASATHEALIGVGFIIGPLIGLAGVAAGVWVGSEPGGMLLALLPLMGACTLGALWPMMKMRSVHSDEPRP